MPNRTSQKDFSPLSRYRQHPARLAEKLYAIRRRFNLTQMEMLNIINPNANEAQRARISLYEHGLRVPSLLEVLNYAKFAQVTMEELVDDDAELNF